MDNNNNELTWLLRLVRQGGSLGALFPIMTTVFIAFLVIGIAMPVLPLHVHQGLELSTFVVGLVAGSQTGGVLAPVGRVGEAESIADAALLADAVPGDDAAPRRATERPHGGLNSANKRNHPG